MTTMNVLDSVGATVAIEKPLVPGSAADAASRPVAWSTEGKAQVGSITETAPATDTASSGLNGRLQRIAQRLTSTIALLPAALGAQGGLKIEGVASGTVVPVSGTITAVTAITNALPAGTNNIGDVDVLTVPADPFGVNADAASLTTSISAKLKGIATALGITALDLGTGTGGSRTLRFFLDTAQFVGGSGANTAATRRVTVATDDTVLGSLTETAPATDTASSGLNGRLQRISQRLTTLIAGSPASLGSLADAASSSTAWSTETKAQVGIITETAPATDTASSGLNGRLQRIAQRLTSTIALLPAALGAGGGLKVQMYNAAGSNVDPLPPGTAADSASVPVAWSTEGKAQIGIVTETAPATDTASSGLNGRLQRIAQRITSNNPLGTAAMAAARPVTIATDDTQLAALLAAVRARCVAIVPTCTAAATTSTQILAATEVLTAACAANDVPAGLRVVTARYLDRTVGLATRIWLLSKNSSIGTEASTFTVADADADDLIGYVDFAAADFIANSANCFAQKTSDLWCKPATGTKDLYIGVQSMESIDLGAATDLVLEFQFI